MLTLRAVFLFISIYINKPLYLLALYLLDL